MLLVPQRGVTGGVQTPRRGRGLAV